MTRRGGGGSGGEGGGGGGGGGGAGSDVDDPGSNVVIDVDDAVDASGAFPFADSVSLA